MRQCLDSLGRLGSWAHEHSGDPWGIVVCLARHCGPWQFWSCVEFADISSAVRIGRNESELVSGNGPTVGMRFRIRNATGNGPESIGMRRNRFPVLAMVGLGRNGLELVSGSGYM